jgi:hypothetical protein
VIGGGRHRALGIDPVRRHGREHLVDLERAARARLEVRELIVGAVQVDLDRAPS